MRFYHSSHEAVSGGLARQHEQSGAQQRDTDRNYLNLHCRHGRESYKQFLSLPATYELPERACEPKQRNIERT